MQNVKRKYKLRCDTCYPIFKNFRELLSLGYKRSYWITNTRALDVALRKLHTRTMFHVPKSNRIRILGTLEHNTFVPRKQIYLLDTYIGCRATHKIKIKKGDIHITVYTGNFKCTYHFQTSCCSSSCFFFRGLSPSVFTFVFFFFGFYKNAV